VSDTIKNALAAVDKAAGAAEAREAKLKAELKAFLKNRGAKALTQGLHDRVIADVAKELSTLFVQ
jgi:hypothetical protein